MNILFTAEHDNRLEELLKLGTVKIEGWAKGLPKLTEEELCELVKDVEIIITSYDDITKKVIDSAPKLKLIACTRANPVNIDTKYAKEKEIPVLYTPGRNSDSAAEMTLGLMLSVARHIPQGHNSLINREFTGEVVKETKEGLRADVVWDITVDSPYSVFKGCELKGKTLGIIGYGSIGRRVGKIARAFGMELLIFDPYLSEVDIEEIGVKVGDWDTVLSLSDFITAHLKVTPATTNIINKEAFSKMKSSAYFINTARAAIVDEKALIEALQNKVIAGAGLDVFEVEPLPGDHPFLDMKNVVMTPHIAGATTEVLTNHTKMIISDIKRFINKQDLLYQYKN